MNQSIFLFLYGFAHQAPTADGLIVFFAAYLGYVILLVLGAHVLFAQDMKAQGKIALTAFIAAGLSWVIAGFLKVVLSTPRPALLLSHVVPLFSESSGALPSNHAAFFGGLAFSLVFSKMKHSYWYVLAAVLVGIARVAAGVHWPIDIVNGFLIGFVCAFAVNAIKNLFSV